MNKFLKPVCLTGVVVTIIISCNSIKSLPVPKGINNAVPVVAKNEPLTNEQKNHWQHYDLAKDTIPGMSVYKAYDFLKGKKNIPVIVGVIDSGTDLKHEDLQENAWVNQNEIPNNGKDDDGNGYIDDINGWNFIGKIDKENYESDRILHNPKLVSDSLYKIIQKKRQNKSVQAKKMIVRYTKILEEIKYVDEKLSTHLKKEDYNKEDVENIKTENADLQKIINTAKMYYSSYNLPSLKLGIKELTKALKRQTNLAGGKAKYVNYREILGDDENNFDTKYYGDGNTGYVRKDELHGSHVSGIIGAVRCNRVGMEGIAKNVKIMAVRAVPDGDEYDKDIALAIRYAVDMGAKVINTSFGKGYSPKKQWVYDAIKYAAKKDVLIVNAAGNDAKNMDVEYTYPNDSKDLKTEISDNLLSIGAMSYNYNEKMLASFSNYGKINVDIFAPGVKIYSTTPENEYKKLSGTSMAAPSTSGVAAMIRSYYPQLSASQVKHIIMNSGTKIDIKVLKPGSIEKVDLSELCVSGRIVNAYNAVKMADRIVNGK